jgi:hypothetical protein
VGPRSGSASGAHEVAQSEVSEEQSESRNKDHAFRPYFPCRITAVLAYTGECANGRERQKKYTCHLMPESRKNVRKRVKDRTRAAVGGPQPAIAIGLLTSHAADNTGNSGTFADSRRFRHNL